MDCQRGIILIVAYVSSSILEIETVLKLTSVIVSDSESALFDLNTFNILSLNIL